MTTIAEETEVLLTVECKEPEGTFQREVRLCILSLDKLRYLYERLSKFDVLFYEGKNDIDTFIKSFVAIYPDGSVEAHGIVLEVDDVGLIKFTSIEPGRSAEIHIVFWDRRFRGREELVKQVIKHAMELLDLHRVSCQIPLYSAPLLGAVERVGFIKEGRLRQATFYKGKWYDVNQYSVLRGEV